MRRIRTTRVADFVFAPLVYPSAWLLECIRKYGVQNFPRSRQALLRMGVFPIRNHYTEPQFDLERLKTASNPRRLPGIDWNLDEQRALLRSLTFADELKGTPVPKPEGLEYYFDNAAFGPGDAEYLYQIIRLKKPRRILEIGSGNSTLMALKAVRKNEAEDPSYRCEHVCIEPFEAAWLEKTGVSVLRERVEDVGVERFADLGENDLLFIDSSHVIRPEGDVLFEYLELLPSLKPGVIVHIHDIFSPRNYPEQWLVDWVRLWNEQYLLEAFLSHNSSWKIIGALNYLRHEDYEALRTVAPFLTPDREPGSFYMQKVA
jgi:predicted O-methyltransferase YrrM